MWKIKQTGHAWKLNHCDHIIYLWKGHIPTFKCDTCAERIPDYIRIQLLLSAPNSEAWRVYFEKEKLGNKTRGE